jgi:hypothetical protein
MTPMHLNVEDTVTHPTILIPKQSIRHNLTTRQIVFDSQDDANGKLLVTTA